jgi:hypothetical protein
LFIDKSIGINTSQATTMAPSLEAKLNMHHSGISDDHDNLSKDDFDDSFNSFPDCDSAISKPGEHDVLLGRGGGTNNHIGNIHFRKLVNEHKMRYLASPKVDKPKVAREVVHIWRKMNPPGRFLARKDEGKKGPSSAKDADNIWYEVGDKKAREKASQCLRERTADVIPYIKQLREHQDAMTEQGVSMVSHQLQMQQQQENTQLSQGFNDCMANASLPGSNQVSPVNAYFRHSAIGVIPGEIPSAPLLNHVERRTSMPATGFQPSLGSMIPRRTSAPYMSSQMLPQPDHMHFSARSCSTGARFFNPVMETEEQAYHTAVRHVGDMTEMEYQQRIMRMQQQLQVNHMHLQRLQQHQMMTKCNNDMFTPPAVAPTSGQVFNFEEAPLSSPPPTRSSLRQVTPPTPQAATKKSKPAKSKTTKRSRKGDSSPERPPSALPSEDVDESELTLEEYRQQLEKYINNTHSHCDEIRITSSHDVDDGFDSDLEDDWEKEKEKALLDFKLEHRRGVSRNPSGMSFASIKSGTSILTGFTDLSDMMMASHDENPRLSLSSTLSLMSDMTDLSHNIDNLSLYDD